MMSLSSLITYASDHLCYRSFWYVLWLNEYMLGTRSVHVILSRYNAGCALGFDVRRQILANQSTTTTERRSPSNSNTFRVTVIIPHGRNI